MCKVASQARNEAQHENDCFGGYVQGKRAEESKEQKNFMSFFAGCYEVGRWVLVFTYDEQYLNNE